MDLISLIVIILMVIVVVVLLALPNKNSSSAWKATLSSSLSRAESKIYSKNYSEVKDSLIEIDKLLDYLLKNKKVNGETLGERLKNSKNIFSKKDYNEIWNAHKLRNALVHEVENQISMKQIQSASKTLLSLVKKYS
jgi:biopolymer transport protein ExbD